MAKRFLTSKKLFVPAIFTIFLTLSLFLFFHTFYVDRNGDINIAGKLWSDFGSTFPIIRSFSKGTNFPPEYPIFSGTPIRYHFGFYALVGFLEKTGIRIDIALNGLSALSFAGLLTILYLFTLKLFKKHSIAATSVLLFLFNGSLGFLEFFKKNPLSSQTLSQIINNSSFSTFGPYDGKIVSAFWNLNIYTNQRHLALAYAAFFAILGYIHLVSRKPDKFTINRSMFTGLIIGFFPFIHMAVFGMLLVLLGTCFLVYPKLRLKLILSGLVAAVIAFPMIAYMGSPQVKTPYFHFGYLVENLTVFNFIYYWFMNLGFNFVLPVFGFLLADRNQRKIFLPFLMLFIVGDVFRFSPEIAANHKFFNLYLAGAVIFSAFFLNYLWNIKIIGKILAPVVLGLSILSGIIDFFPVINDGYLKLTDIKNDPAATWVLENTKPTSVILNSRFIYDPASVAGRKIYLGWPYFSWSAGYDTETRFKILKQILSVDDTGALCNLLKRENIDYVELENPSEFENEGAQINYPFFETLLPEYKSKDSKVVIYSRKNICPNI